MVRFEERARSLLNVGAPREAERNIDGDYFLHAHRPIPAYATGLAAANLVLKKIGRRPQSRYLDSPSNRPGPTLTLQPSGENRSFLFFFFAAEKASIRLVVPREIGTEIVPRNEFLAFRRMRIADCDSGPQRSSYGHRSGLTADPGESSEGSAVLIPRYRAPPFGLRHVGLKAGLSRYLSWQWSLYYGRLSETKIMKSLRTYTLS